jgi:hypothetical protein
LVDLGKEHKVELEGLTEKEVEEVVTRLVRLDERVAEAIV